MKPYNQKKTMEVKNKNEQNDNMYNSFDYMTSGSFGGCI
jgi:hypothetical protein